MRLTQNGKPFAPKPGDVGSELTFAYAGAEITGQVWSEAPAQPRHGTYGRLTRSVWVVANGAAFLVNRFGVVCGTYSVRAEVAA